MKSFERNGNFLINKITGIVYWLVGMVICFGSYWLMGHVSEFINAHSCDVWFISRDYARVLWLYGFVLLFSMATIISFALMKACAPKLPDATVFVGVVFLFGVGFVNAIRFIEQMGRCVNMENYSFFYICSVVGVAFLFVVMVGWFLVDKREI